MGYSHGVGLLFLKDLSIFGVNLICVEDDIDSSKVAGKLMISVLSAVAEIERENIRVQTMEGRIQKASDGKENKCAAIIKILGEDSTTDEFLFICFYL